MAENSSIEWTDHTWNPWYGCQKVSSGCTHCYMFHKMKQYGKDPNTVQRSKTTFNKPLGWAKRYPGQRVFTCSWSDFFHPAADLWRAEAWDVIRRTPELHYLILTKRPELAGARLPGDWGDGWPHVWIGASIENQAVARMRLRDLLKIPAHHRFLSLEPLLEYIDLIAAAPAVEDETVWHEVNMIDDDNPPEELIEEDECDYNDYGELVVNPEYSEWLRWRRRLAKRILLSNEIHWLIVGGESGPDARPCHPDWVRALRDFCVDTETPFFFKQWGRYMPLEADPALAAQGQGISVRYLPVGKREAGRLLDGREWLELPEEFAAVSDDR